MSRRKMLVTLALHVQVGNTTFGEFERLADLPEGFVSRAVKGRTLGTGSKARWDRIARELGKLPAFEW